MWEIWCLRTVTFCQKSPKLNSRPVYCSRLYSNTYYIYIIKKEFSTSHLFEEFVRGVIYRWQLSVICLAIFCFFVKMYHNISVLFWPVITGKPSFSGNSLNFCRQSVSSIYWDPPCFRQRKAEIQSDTVYSQPKVARRIWFVLARRYRWSNGNHHLGQRCWCQRWLYRSVSVSSVVEF